MKSDFDWDTSVRKYFEFLFEEFGFALVSNSYDPDHFGNRITILESGSHHVSIILDRSILSIDIGSIHNKSNSKPLFFIVSYLKDDPRFLIKHFVDTWPGVKEMDQLEMHAKTFKENVEEILDLFREENLKKTIDGMDKYREKIDLNEISQKYKEYRDQLKRNQ